MNLLDEALSRRLSAHTVDEAVDVIVWLDRQIQKATDGEVIQTLNKYRQDLLIQVKKGE